MVAATHPHSRSTTGVDRHTPVPGSLRVLAETTRTILIVDDEPFMCDLAARVLRTAGYLTRSAKGGREAIDLLRRDPTAVQLVLLDLLMPDLDGWATLAELRQIRGNLAIVLTGGQPEEEVLAHKGDAQNVTYLAKPYALEALVAVVGRAFQ
jgi:two-component system cell cycle sensor histidine kinase/response regulator CckA